MRSVGTFEAKTHLSEILDQVAKGESIAITKRGVPIAVIVPVAETQQEVRKAVEELRQWRRGISWDDGMDTRTAITEGRK